MNSNNNFSKFYSEHFITYPNQGGSGGGHIVTCLYCNTNIFKSLAQDHLRECSPEKLDISDQDYYDPDFFFEQDENPIDVIDGRLKIIKEQKQMRRGDKCALISSQWMALWRDSKATPIDNLELLDSDGNLKPNLNSDYDFEVLPYDIWQYFVNQFGGGPGIFRSVVAMGLFFQVDLYPLSLIFSIKYFQVKHSVSRFQSIKGLLYEIGALTYTAPSSYSISVVGDNAEVTPVPLGNYIQTLHELNIKDGTKFIIDSITRPGHNCGSSSSSSYHTGSSYYGSYSSNFVPKHTTGTPLVKGMVGFQNLGNTCYMNSVLSSLCHCLPFCNSLLKMSKPENIPFLRSFQKLVSCYWSNKYSALNPTDFRNKVLKVTTLFAGYNQQCAHEFICFLLDALHEDLKKLPKEHHSKKQEIKQLSNEANDEGKLKMDESDKQAEVKAENEIRKEEEMIDSDKKFESGEIGEMDVDTNFVDPNLNQMPTHVEELFEGKYNSEITCNTCKAQFDKEENFLHLSLPVPTLETKLIVVTYFPQRGPAKRYGLRPSRNGNVSELRILLSQLTGTPVEHLKFSEVYSNKKFELKDDKLIMAFKDSETIVADEIVPGSFQLELLHRKPSKRNCGFQSSLCGFPLTLTITPGMSNNEIHALIQEKLGHLLSDDLKIFEKLYQTFLVNLESNGDEEIPILANDHIFDINEHNGEQQKRLAEIASLNEEAQRMGEKIANQETATNDDPEANPMSANKTEADKDAKEKDENETSATEDEDTVDQNMDVEEKVKPEAEKGATKSNSPIILTIVLNWEEELTKDMVQKVFSSIAADESTKPTDAERNFEIQLTDSIDMFLAEEEISQDNAWFCPSCKQLTPIKKQLSFLKLPHVLVLHLKRFEYTLLYRQKITTLVNYPLLNLDLSAYINHAGFGDHNHENQPHSSYNLFAVSNHMGGLSGGHYTAYVRKDDDIQQQQQQINNGESVWFEINDSTASPVDSSKVCSRSGYLLFYHSTSCQCDHLAEMTNILDGKMAKSMDKKLAKEVADGSDVTQQIELETDTGNSADSKSGPQDSSLSNEKKIKRVGDDSDSIPQKKQKRGSGNRAVSERRNPSPSHESIIALASMQTSSRGHSPPNSRMTMMCAICHTCVASNEDEFVDHVFAKHNEQEALFALSAAGLGDENAFNPEFIVDEFSSESMNQKLIESANPNNQIVQINNQGNNHPDSSSDQRKL
jgi:ubiquitin carboxyl-terminal hydrolase 4/11/15